jgi:hypothetical protein
VLYAYVDETGDRTPGANQGNSAIFGMAAVLTTETSDALLRDALIGLKKEFGIPDSTVMTAKRHLKSDKRRLRAAEVLGSIPDLKVIFCYATKSEVTGNYTQNATVFYNWVAMQTYKRILWAARDWRGRNEKIRSSFGHVKGHDHEATDRYFERQIPLENRVPSHMEAKLRWVSASTYEAMQAADIYASFLWKLAEFERPDRSHFEVMAKVWHQIRTDSKGCPVSLGILSMPNDQIFLNAGWNNCPHCGQK